MIVAEAKPVHNRISDAFLYTSDLCDFAKYFETEGPPAIFARNCVENLGITWREALPMVFGPTGRRITLDIHDADFNFQVREYFLSDDILEFKSEIAKTANKLCIIADCWRTIAGKIDGELQIRFCPLNLTTDNFRHRDIGDHLMMIDLEGPGPIIYDYETPIVTNKGDLVIFQGALDHQAPYEKLSTAWRGVAIFQIDSYCGAESQMLIRAYEAFRTMKARLDMQNQLT